MIFNLPVNQEYQSILGLLLANGVAIHTRNSEARRLIGWQSRFDKTPLVGVRKTAWKNCLREMEWILSGSSNIKDLHPAVHSWWEPWADKDGRVAFNYSEQLRHYGSHGVFDQIGYLVDGLKKHPYSRRNLITTWNTEQMVDPQCPITNCHGIVIHTFVEPDRSLHLLTYQRSVDTVCGLPHNWLQYWALLLWLASEATLRVGSLIWVGGDVHLYKVHEELAQRIIREDCPTTPNLVHSPTEAGRFRADDFTLDGPYLVGITERAEMIV
jgi:thymidylate synthase